MEGQSDLSPRDVEGSFWVTESSTFAGNHVIETPFINRPNSTLLVARAGLNFAPTLPVL